MSKSKNTHTALIFAFLILLITPTALFMYNLDLEDDTLIIDYHRPKQTVLSLKNNYTEHFGLKQPLFSFYKTIKAETLHEPVLPNRVIEGNEGWYFLGNHYEEILNDHFGNRKLSQQELFEITRKIEAIQKALEKREIELVLLVPPNKHSVYGEYLPYQLSQGKTALEQIKAHLATTIGFEILDLNTAVRNQKKGSQLYYKTNSHWTDIGAFYGYKETLHVLEKKLNSNLHQVQLTDYNKIVKPIEESDITAMVQLNVKEEVVYLEKKDKKRAKFVNSSNGYLHFKNEYGNKKLLIYKDSFTNQLMPFLNESFAETWYTIDYSIDYNFIDEIKPDVVVIEIIERNLVYNLLNNKKPLE